MMNALSQLLYGGSCYWIKGFVMPIDRDEIARVLKERRAIKPCHRCGEMQFTVLDGYSKMTLEKEIQGGLVIGAPIVPVATIACDNCGAITSHALGPLGLLPKKEEEEG